MRASELIGQLIGQLQELIETYHTDPTVEIEVIKLRPQGYIRQFDSEPAVDIKFERRHLSGSDIVIIRKS